MEIWLNNFTLRLLALALVGLCIGSFLNVVIYRLPLMLQRSWRNQCIDFLQEECQEKIELTTTTSAFNLCVPASHCPHCQASLKWWSNLPLFGYLFVRGRCLNCQQRISVRYPLIEALTAGLFVLAGFKLVSLWVLCGSLIFIALIITLIFIDSDTKLLPDELTLSLLWLGLIFNLQGEIAGSLVNAALGAMLGYLILWSIYWVFKLLTHKEGMGYGDFKLLAAIGAWLGWHSLIPVLLLASLGGIIYALYLQLRSKVVKGQTIAFGPFLGFAGILALFTMKYWFRFW